MKTIEERAKEYSLKDFDGYYTGRENAMEEGYIAGATEQKAIDDELCKKESVLRCRMCKHWGKITYWGENLSSEKYEWLKRVNCSKCCIFFKTKNGKNYRCHSPYQLACEHFEEK